MALASDDFLYTPPETFGIVEEGVYRSNILLPSHFSFLENLGLKCVLLLSPEPPSKPVMSFFEEQNIKLLHLGNSLWKPNLMNSWRPISEELIKEGMEILLNKNNLPMLVMCSSGLHETGTVVGCLRKLQGWNLNSIVGEYRAFAGTKSRYVIEQFIELFDLDLITLPDEQDLPAWFE